MVFLEAEADARSRGVVILIGEDDFESMGAALLDRARHADGRIEGWRRLRDGRMAIEKVGDLMHARADRDIDARAEGGVARDPPLLGGDDLDTRLHEAAGGEGRVAGFRGGDGQGEQRSRVVRRRIPERHLPLRPLLDPRLPRRPAVGEEAPCHEEAPLLPRILRACVGREEPRDLVDREPRAGRIWQLRSTFLQEDVRAAQFHRRALRGELPGEQGDLRLDDARRHGEARRAGRKPPVRSEHEVVPIRTGAIETVGSFIEGGAVRIADPHARCELRGVPDDPAVVGFAQLAESLRRIAAAPLEALVAGPRLCRRLEPRYGELRLPVGVGAHRHVAQDGGDLVRDSRIEDLLLALLGLRLKEDVSLSVGDAAYAHDGPVSAAAREGAVGVDHLEEGGFGSPERQRPAVVKSSFTLPRKLLLAQERRRRAQLLGERQDGALSPCQEERLGCGDIPRCPQRLPDREGAPELPIEVLWLVGPEVRGDVVEHGGGAVPLLGRGGSAERLEAGARLPRRADHVDLPAVRFVAVIHVSHVREDFLGLRMKRDEGDVLRAVPPGDVFVVEGNDLLRDLLEFPIERGFDREAAAFEEPPLRRAAEHLFHLFAHPQHEVRGADGFAGGLEGHLLQFLERRQALLFRDGTLVLHVAQHLVGASADVERRRACPDRRSEEADRDRLIGNIRGFHNLAVEDLLHRIGGDGGPPVLAVGTEVRGPLRQRREHGGLREGELLHRRPEIHLARLFRAVGVMPEGDPVEVEVQELVFAVEALELAAEEELLHLPEHERVLGQVESVAGKLPRDRGGSARASHADDGARNRPQVDAASLIEPLILDCDDRLLQIHGNAIPFDEGSIFLLEEAVELHSIAILYHGAAGGEEARRVLNIGEREPEECQGKAKEGSGEHQEPAERETGNRACPEDSSLDDGESPPEAQRGYPLPWKIVLSAEGASLESEGIHGQRDKECRWP